ncbi:hypothetical protein GCM10010470_24430 [Saccharopolyspora taberi]|uniref:Uncharacterized protein n=1 Tax=Saccharopolyspora taberi TaxID=60895 RepID=A0ABN3VC34_9PSEU
MAWTGSCGCADATAPLNIAASTPAADTAKTRFVNMALASQIGCGVPPFLPDPKVFCGGVPSTLRDLSGLPRIQRAGGDSLLAVRAI